jgi:hypothetical protein
MTRRTLTKDQATKRQTFRFGQTAPDLHLSREPQISQINTDAELRSQNSELRSQNSKRRTPSSNAEA